MEACKRVLMPARNVVDVEAVQVVVHVKAIVSVQEAGSVMRKNGIDQIVVAGDVVDGTVCEINLVHR